MPLRFSNETFQTGNKVKLPINNDKARLKYRELSHCKT